MPKVAIRRSKSGHVYLNAGCGAHYSPDWNNLDLYENRDVVRHDLRKALPYQDSRFDAVYSSHILEHLDPQAGARFVREMRRVCKPGGVCRIVTPDYERTCREYLRRLETAAGDPSPGNLHRYRWSFLELVDQFVRQRCGGKMLETLRAGDFDPDYVRARNGDEFACWYERPAETQSRSKQTGLRGGIKRSSLWPLIRPGVALLRALGNGLRRPPDPRTSGELHRWIYDRLSLRFLMEEAGFTEVKERSYDESRIPDWQAYRLDTSASGDCPRKPDSLYMEGRTPL